MFKRGPEVVNVTRRRRKKYRKEEKEEVVVCKASGREKGARQGRERKG